MRRSVFKYPDGAAPNLAAIGYVLAGHALGVGLLLAGGAAARALGFLLVAHTLLCATYLMHECMHETLYRDRRLHEALGRGLGWLTGAEYAGFETLRKKHLHHHLDRSDPIAFDFRRALAAAPPALRRVVLGLEWLHVPALEAWLRGRAIWQPLTSGTAAERAWMLGLVASRIAAAVALYLVSPIGLALYAAAFVAAIVLGRFFDAFHHTFDLVLLESYDEPFGSPPGKDRAYEDANTYSNLLSSRWPTLNLLLLNFPYHNAHHAKPGLPWHRLPSLDRQLYGADDRRLLPAGSMLAAFHRFRIERLVGTLPPAADARELGATGVSLLTI